MAGPEKGDREEPRPSFWLREGWWMKVLSGEEVARNPLIRLETGVASRRYFWEDALIVGPWVGLTLVEGVVFLSLVGALRSSALGWLAAVLTLFEFFLLPVLHGCLVGVASLGHVQAVTRRVALEELALTKVSARELVDGLRVRPLSVAMCCALSSSYALFGFGLLAPLVLLVFKLRVDLGSFAVCSLTVWLFIMLFRILTLNVLAEFASAHAVWAALFQGGSAPWWFGVKRPLLLWAKWMTFVWVIPAVCLAMVGLLCGPILELSPVLVLLAIVVWLIALPVDATFKASELRQATLEAFRWHEWGAGMVEEGKGQRG